MIDGLAQLLRPGPPGVRAGRRGVARRRRPGRVPWRTPRRPGVLIALLAAVGVIGGGWLWLRDSSLVAVKRVTVVGASGADGGQVRAALILAARNMTTLDVRMDQLRSAVAPFPVVKGLSVSTQFPHGMQIRVTEQIPVGVVVVDGRRIAVAGDGTLLHDVPPSQGLPVIPLRVPPGGSRVTERAARGAVAVLGAAPYQLLERVSQIAETGSHGLVAQLRNGPSIYFGDASQPLAKWTAAAEVLADPGSAGALYIDVSDPYRPAAGGVGPHVSTTPSSGATSGATSTTTAGGAPAGTGGASQSATATPSQTTTPSAPQTTPVGG